MTLNSRGTALSLGEGPKQKSRMFRRNQSSRATIARGSALEMEIRRGKFRQSVLMETPQHVSSREQWGILHHWGPNRSTCPWIETKPSLGLWQKALLKGTGGEDKVIHLKLPGDQEERFNWFKPRADATHLPSCSAEDCEELLSSLSEETVLVVELPTPGIRLV
ncbi:hypothetical protein DNTS_004571 [Danionella cerebrum]|uniref:Uncharacterized protein n=1 Tax=Danionella cerebrum TaxID=2873325 RepID=A0A553QGN4_9TELE|nr:hypothetical protein DNTS_004571 [Danionella translucida]